MKIAIVTQYYKPEVIHIPHTLAEGLARRGHSVRVITTFPNYPEGKVFSGYRQKLRHVERDGGVLVKRVPVILSHSTNPIGRFANYASFALSACLAGRFVRGADVVYVYATQMTPAWGPSVWRRLIRLPFVMHVQDLWPESVTGSSMVGDSRAKRIIDALLNPWLRSLYRTAAATIAIAPTMARTLTERGVPDGRISTVLNWTDEANYARPSDAVAEPDVPPASDGLTVTYAGNLGDHQDLETVIRAAKLTEDLPGLTVTMVGSGMAESRLHRMAQALGVANVIFAGRVSPSEMRDIYAKSDFQIVCLKDRDIFRGTIPSKLQASLAGGVPVITSVAGDVTTLVTENDLGFVARPEDPESLAESFRRAYRLSAESRRDMARRSREFYERTMSADRGIDHIETILTGAAGGSRARK